MILHKNCLGDREIIYGGGNFLLNWEKEGPCVTIIFRTYHDKSKDRPR